MTEKVLITSALPYANGPLHFGHIAGAYLPGDCYARYCRLRGRDVLYVCGSDEHGVAITLSAEKAGRTPQEQIDKYHQVIKTFFRQLDLSFDHYSRTSWEGHVQPSQQFFLDLLENGYIEPRVSNQLYSEQDERFLADRYVVGTCPNCGYEQARGDECPKCGFAYEATDLKNPRSVLSKAPLVLKATKHWYLLLDKFREPLLKMLEERDWRPNVQNFVKKYIEGLRARAITRDSSWGIPVPLPEAEGKVLYVWFDAPIGYISSSMQWAQEQGSPERWKDYWLDPACKLIHFIGKDNIPFHAAIFPAMCMGQNQDYKLVDELPANEFYKLEGRQFSKSEGWYVDLDDFFSHFSADQIRYAIAANAPESSDSEFTWADFQQRCNNELLGKYGNLANRTLVFAARQCASTVPARAELEEEDSQFLAEVKEQVAKIEADYERFSLRSASQGVMALAQLGNRYFDAKQPWKDAKEPEKAGRLATTIACCLECLKCLALVSSPIIPSSAQALYEQLGYSGELAKLSWDSVRDTPIVEGQSLPEAKRLFAKVEDALIQSEVEKLHALAAKAEAERPVDYAPLKEEIEINDFQGVDLRVGIVKQAERVPKSKRLLKLQVDLGFEERCIVSGIREHYETDDLVGRKVVVVANLKPAKLMGIESQGMVLAGNFGKSLELVNLDELPAGAVVY